MDDCTGGKCSLGVGERRSDVHSAGRHSSQTRRPVMSGNQRKQAEELFQIAVDLDPADRDRFLADRPGYDPDAKDTDP